MIAFIFFLIGYFAGMCSCLLQIIRMENREDKKIQDILNNK